MSNFLNHYETLNVSNDASTEQIKASYLKLYKLFHPDLNPDMMEGLEMIAELNKAYEILKNPVAKELYDLKFLAEMKRKSNRHTAVEVKKEVPSEPPMVPVSVVQKEIVTEQINEISKRRMQQAQPEKSNNFMKVAAVGAIAIIGFLAVSLSSPGKTASKFSFIDLSDVMATSKYVRPVQAPNGTAFPEATAYISGYELRNNAGSSSLLVDNVKNDHDVFLKLVVVEENKTVAVRHVFIKAKTDFKIENLSTGKYEVQYLDLEAGLVGKSEIFSVEESKSIVGMKSSNKSITLQTAVDGVLRVQTVTIEEFNSLAAL